MPPLLPSSDGPVLRGFLEENIYKTPLGDCFCIASFISFVIISLVVSKQ